MPKLADIRPIADVAQAMVQTGALEEWQTQTLTALEERLTELSKKEHEIAMKVFDLEKREKQMRQRLNRAVNVLNGTED
jgi:hypothetical protein